MEQRRRDYKFYHPQLSVTPRLFSSEPFCANGRRYVPPARPVAVLCLDGSSDDYLEAALTHGRMPNLAEMCREGFRSRALAALPSFTNVNNTSIVCGVPPSVTGICGNFFLDPRTGEEVMMNSPHYLRCETILSAAADAGRKVALVTAKEKLRRLLSRNLVGIAFSAEKANQARASTHGISSVEKLVGAPTPGIYTTEASLFVLCAGVRLLETGQADFLYLSTTDYVQHKHAPEEEEALAFYGRIDFHLGRLLDHGALVALTADHGMSAMNHPDGRPHIVYIESLLQEQFGPGPRVVCPITDPYILHHGALGSLVMVHLPPEIEVARVARCLQQVDGIAEVHSREAAARDLELPIDRIGDLTVMSKPGVALGKTPGAHELDQLTGGLRSHGGRTEQEVPFLVSQPLSPQLSARSRVPLRNFDIFRSVCSGI